MHTRLTVMGLLLTVTACGPTQPSPPESTEQVHTSQRALDSNPQRFLSVRAYGGALRYSSNPSKRTFTDPQSTATVTVECDEQVSGTLYLEQVSAAEAYWEGSFKGEAQHHCVRHTRYPDGYFTRQTYSAPAHAFDTNARVFIMPTVPPAQPQQFALIYGDYQGPGSFIPQTRTFESPIQTTSSNNQWLIARWWKQAPHSEYWPLPTSGLQLRGSATNDEQAPPCASQNEKIPYKFSFYLLPLELNEIKLVLEPADDYDTWTPSAPSVDPLLDHEDVPPLGGIALSAVRPPRTRTATPVPPGLGNKTHFRALLVGPPDVKAKNITFKLKSSQVPGESNNWPLNPDPSPVDDLVMEPAGGNPITITTSSLSDGDYKTLYTGQTPDGEYELAWVTVASQDWGAFGELRASAIRLDNGSPLEAKVVRFDTSEEASVLRIPKRAADSYIADVWKTAQNMAGKPDDDDTENIPLGDGNKGDGLTLYEEYRGFMENGKHTRGNPLRKDYFLAVSEGFKGMAEGGIALFKNATGLIVHKLDKDEYVHAVDHTDFDPDNRVINFNEAPGGRRKVKQHLVMLTVNDVCTIPPGEKEVKCMGTHTWTPVTGTLGTPRLVSRVDISPNTLADSPDQVAKDIAHELGHTVNIYHHGEGGMAKLFHIFRSDGHQEESYTVPITNPVRLTNVILSESGLQIYDGNPNTQINPEIRKVTLSTRQGNQFSGDEECFMRYNIVTSAAINSSPTERYLIEKPEPIGTTLCSSGAGKKFNLPTNKFPGEQSRHGSAAPNRGDCIHQILVNDAVTAPSR
ncbi:hypothetical protein KYC5002_28550 [Archangium violaceum]|uniref:hypothetical protein n=1 Tax=Archangium violaceum TaxID=83451 RepID=UPI002B315BE5|nr:hypothetical protein KYC5002_28550 [Archangium gephyra]